MPDLRTYRWVCFKCRVAVSRRDHGDKDPRCQSCASPMECVGGMRIPRKRDKKAWKRMEARVAEWDAQGGHRPYLGRGE